MSLVQCHYCHLNLITEVKGQTLPLYTTKRYNDLIAFKTKNISDSLKLLTLKSLVKF